MAEENQQADPTQAPDDRLVQLGRDEAMRLERMGRESLELKGRFDALAQREADLIDKVGKARSRIDDIKPEVEEILEELQTRAHDRSVGAFERMLTGITDDVLPDYKGQRSVRLELGTERNMPALDIFIDHMGDREEVTSGAVANVLSTGLRFIALARSGARRFLVLDEADCWIDGVAVQNYFNVVNQLSRDAGIQTVVITHHDLSAFSEDFRIYRITDVQSNDRHPARRMDLVSAGNMEPSELQDNPFSFIAVKNFEGYPQDAIELSPGVTVIQGPNQRGKSSWARMFRAALMADAGDGIIRHRHPSAEVAIGFADGRVLEFHRNRKGAPKAEFALHSPESWAARLEGMTLKQMRDKDDVVHPLHHTVGAKLPEWMPAETGVHEIDGINVQLWPQFKSVFMLDEPASARASLLAIGRESGHLFAMNETFKSDVADDNKTIREGEKEIAAIRLTLKHAEPLSGAIEKLEALRKEHDDIQAEARRIQELDDLTKQISALRQQQELMTRQLDALSHLSEIPKIEPTERLEAWVANYERAKADSAIQIKAQLPHVPEVAETAFAEQVIAQIGLSAAAERASKSLPAFPDLPEVSATAEIQGIVDGLARARKDAEVRLKAELPAVPSVEPTQEAASILEGLKSARSASQMEIKSPMPSAPEVGSTQEAEQILVALRVSREAAAALAREEQALLRQMADLERQLQEATDALGNECPVCHSIVTVEMLLGKDGHSHDHAHENGARHDQGSAAAPLPSSLPSPLRVAAAKASKPVEQEAAIAAEAPAPAPSPVRGFRRLGR